MVAFIHPFWPHLKVFFLPCIDHGIKNLRNALASREIALISQAVKESEGPVIDMLPFIDAQPPLIEDSSPVLLNFNDLSKKVEGILNSGGRASMYVDISMAPFEAVKTSYQKMACEPAYALFAPPMQRALQDIINKEEKKFNQTNKEFFLIKSLKRMIMLQKVVDNFAVVAGGLDIEKCARKGSLTERTEYNQKKISHKDVVELIILRELPRTIIAMEKIIKNNPTLTSDKNQLPWQTKEAICRLGHGLASFIIFITGDDILGNISSLYNNELNLKIYINLYVFLSMNLRCDKYNVCTYCTRIVIHTYHIT